jgi:glycosyltransferase involved in cell wall biosynthesis
MKVLLIADIPDWILGKIGCKLSKLLSKYMEVTLIFSRAPGFHNELIKYQENNDLVHFLSSTDIIDFYKYIYIPCVATLWHMVNWGLFDVCSNRIDSLFVCSKQWQDRVISHIPKGLLYRRMRYGLDVNMFKRNRLAKQMFLRQAGLALDTLTFGFSGSALSNEGDRKGIDRLWKCFIQLRKTDIPFILRIIGRGWPYDIVPFVLRPYTIIDLDIDDSLLPEYYSSLDYYICTSREEGVPYPVIEAMSCECVVVSTQIGIVPEIICHGYNGFIMQENNIENDFMDAVLKTSYDPEIRLSCGQLARETMLLNYSWDNVVNHLDYLLTYEDAIHMYFSRPVLLRYYYLLRAKTLLIFHKIFLKVKRNLYARRVKQMLTKLFQIITAD